VRWWTVAGAGSESKAAQKDGSQSHRLNG
jgi:hypothetical protein